MTMHRSNGNGLRRPTIGITAMMGGVDLNTPGLTIVVTKAATAIAQPTATAARRREPDGHRGAASLVPLALAGGTFADNGDCAPMVAGSVETAAVKR